MGAASRWLGVSGLVTACTLIAASQAWPSRPADELVIHIWKGRHQMQLVEGERVLRSFEVALGREPTASKLYQGDGHTPGGRYYICEKHPQSPFHRFLGISYPNVDDAERAFAQHLITADQWADIFFANLRQTTPPWSTPMGGSVGIHGTGGAPIHSDWTAGCIAVSDPDIDYLYDRVPLGTRVVIDD